MNREGYLPQIMKCTLVFTGIHSFVDLLYKHVVYSDSILLVINVTISASIA